MCSGVMYGMVRGRSHPDVRELAGGFMEESLLCNVRFNYVNRFFSPCHRVLCMHNTIPTTQAWISCFFMHSITFWSVVLKNQENNPIMIATVALCRSFTFPKVAWWKTSELSRSWPGCAISSRSFSGTCRNSRRPPTRTSRWFSSSTNDMVSLFYHNLV